MNYDFEKYICKYAALFGIVLLLCCTIDGLVGRYIQMQRVYILRSAVANGVPIKINLDTNMIVKDK